MLWSAMPPDGQGRLSGRAELLYDRIVEANGGKSSGFFDVFAWNNEKIVFIEYKGEGDSPNKNETKWINSAIRCGVRTEDLIFVSY